MFRLWVAAKARKLSVTRSWKFAAPTAKSPPPYPPNQKPGNSQYFGMSIGFAIGLHSGQLPSTAPFGCLVR